MLFGFEDNCRQREEVFLTFKLLNNDYKFLYLENTKYCSQAFTVCDAGPS